MTFDKKSYQKKYQRKWYEANREKINKRHREYNRVHKENLRKYDAERYQKLQLGIKEYRWGKIGLNSKEAVRIYQSVNICGICNEPNISGKNKQLDHDHITMKIRGVLCNNCNNMLGRAHDNIEILQNAISYLRGDNR